MIDPGNSPIQNVRFLVFLAATIRAISLYGDLLRISIANPPNDHRLGAAEAPPAIISMYVGDQLAQVIDELTDETGSKTVKKLPSTMQLGVTALPTLPRDQSDRNRTSAFAFTGNRFEFRAVGSSASPARPSMTLNTIVADSIRALANEIEELLKKGVAKAEAIHSVVVKNLKEHKRAVFNGNGYTEEWVQEAKTRGLPNLKSVPEAVAQLCSEKNFRVFEEMKVLSRGELQAHQHVLYEEYIKTLNIEARCMQSIAMTQILPACYKYKKLLGETTNMKSAAQAKHFNSFDESISALIESANALSASLDEADEKFGDEQLHEHATFMKDVILEKEMVSLRKACDALEVVVDDDLWPIPKYSEMLFLK